MSPWLLVAPERDDDDALVNSAWIAQQTIDVGPHKPTELRGQAATRSALEGLVQGNPPTGVAFFGHGATDRLFAADRQPGDPAGPAILDEHNIGLLRGSWVHAFACWSGRQLASRATAQGVAFYVGYTQGLDVGFSIPPLAEAEFTEMVTCTTRALLAGERNPTALRRQVSAAVDAFYIALDRVPEANQQEGYVWVQALADNLVNAMAIYAAGGAAGGS